MLVNNINCIEHPERVSSLLPIRSIIGLDHLNISPDIIIESFKSSDEFLIPFEEDGETSQCIPSNSDRPSDIIESRTQSVSNFTNQKSPRDGVLLDKIGADDIKALFRYFLIAARYG